MSSDFHSLGWGFPPVFSLEKKTVCMVSVEEDIRQSLAILLGTSVGERFLQPTFGCHLADYAFRSLDVSSQLHIKELVADAIDAFEPRITLDKVLLNTDNLSEGALLIEVFYIVNETNAMDSFVYPFYLENR